MSDNGGAGKADATRLDEIAERLARIELLLVGSLQDEVEGNEPEEVPELPGGLESASAAAASVAPLPVRFDRFIDRLQLPNFSGAEFTPYWSRVRNGVRNSPPPEGLWGNVTRTLAVLQRFRAEHGSAVQLLSTYRSPAYNQAVGGAAKSQHEQFRAIDFTSSRGTPAQWAEVLRGYRGRRFEDPLTGEEFTFRGGIGVYPKSGFVHLDTRGKDADW